MMRVGSCCCCVSLHRGGMIIGTIDFIVALATLIIGSIGAAITPDIVNAGGRPEANPMSELIPMYITMAVLNGLLLLFDILLLYGVTQARPKLILPWILYAYVSLLLNFICALTFGIYNLNNYDFFGHHELWGYISISWSIIYVVLKIYFLLVIWSLYQQMMGATRIGQQPHPNGLQTYQNGQMQYPNQPQSYPSVQVQQPFPYPEQPNPNPQPLPSMDEIKRDI